MSQAGDANDLMNDLVDKIAGVCGRKIMLE